MKGRSIILMLFYLKGMKMSDDSDSCLMGKEIRKLEREGKCASISHGGSEKLQWEECMEKLSEHLDRKCKGHGVYATQVNSCICYLLLILFIVLLDAR